jgi:2-desacetyl-2-hydroxyethyl bacteriochlorophyllide A dehydrogenase
LRILARFAPLREIRLSPKTSHARTRRRKENAKSETIMKNIVLHEPGRFSLTETTAARAPSAGEAVVRVRRVGICGTDLHAFQGEQPFFTYPRVLGHELGVEIVSIRDNAEGLRAGDHCAVEPYLNCGGCIACRKGKTNCCESIQVLGVHTDGGLCELLTVPANKLHKSETLSLDQLALVEPLCIGAHAVARAQIEAGEWALVVGAGPIGLAVIQSAQLSGARVMVMDVNRERLNFARQRFPVAAAIQATDDAVDRVKEITGGDLATLVFDATGNQQAMNASFALPANGGRLVYVGLVQGSLSFFDPEAHRRELSVLFSRNASGADFKRVIGLLEDGVIDIKPWITHRATFGEDVIGQFPLWLNPQSRFIKALIEV